MPLASGDETAGNRSVLCSLFSVLGWRGVELNRRLLPNGCRNPLRQRSWPVATSPVAQVATCEIRGAGGSRPAFVLRVCIDGDTLVAAYVRL
jgi:hypothetical protein